MRRSLGSALLVLVGLLLTCAISCVVVGYIGDAVEYRRLEVFAEGLHDYPLPPDTEVVSRRSEFGNVGNGNNCWYRAEQWMVSALPPEAIEAYYADVVFPRISFGRWDAVYDTPRETPVWLEYDPVPAFRDRTYFRAILFDVGLDVNQAPRCH